MRPWARPPGHRRVQPPRLPGKSRAPHFGPSTGMAGQLKAGAAWRIVWFPLGGPGKVSAVSGLWPGLSSAASEYLGSTTMERARWVVPALHAVWGGVLVYVPARLLRLTGAPPSPAARRLLRALGARHLAQAVVTAARPGPGPLRAGSVTDLLHAASCAGLAVTDPRWRRPAILGGLGAMALAAAGLTAASSAEHQAGGPEA